MKPARILALALFAAVLVPVASADDADPLIELRNRWVVAIREGDAARAASVFADDAALMPPGFPTFVGRKAIESFYRDGFALASVSAFEVHPKARRVGTSTFRERGTYRITWQPKDNSAPYTVVGRYILIASKRADGKWQFLREMHTIESKVPPDQL